jgi:regulator of sigma E protease
MSSILPFLFVLGVLVFVHELGHFLVARWHGVRVLTFSLGFGPKLLKFRRGDTEYCISAIPLGGYVKMAGEMGGDGTPQYVGDAQVPSFGGTVLEGKPDEFMSKTKWQRFQIYLAGPVMNMVLALVVMTFVLWQGATEPLYLQQPAKVGSIAHGTAAERVGLKPGDVIVRVAGKDIATWEQLDMVVLPRAGRELDVVVRRPNGDGIPQELTLKITPDSRTKYEMGDLGVMPEFHPQIAALTPGDPAAQAGLKDGDVVHAVNGTSVNRDELMKRIAASPNQPLTFTIVRGSQRMDIAVTPARRGDIGRIGASLTAAEERRIEPGFLQAAKMSVQRNLEWSTLIFQTFAGLFKGETSTKQLMGPVGIAELSGTAAQVGFVALFNLMAMISLNLGILNLLPIPMLDGGHIFIMALEGVARRDFSLRVKEKLLMAGFVAIMALMVVVVYNDLTRIEWIERLMPWRR